MTASLYKHACKAYTMMIYGTDSTEIDSKSKQTEAQGGTKPKLSLLESKTP